MALKDLAAPPPIYPFLCLDLGGGRGAFRVN